MNSLIVLCGLIEFPEYLTPWHKSVYSLSFKLTQVMLKGEAKLPFALPNGLLDPHLA